MGTLKESGIYLLSAGIVLIIYSILHIVRIKVRKEETNLLHWVCLILFTITVTFIYQLTVSPVYGFHLDIRTNEINLQPFRVFSKITENPLNFFGNILMFIPVGTFLVMISKSYGKWYKFMIFGAGISLSIEIAQLFLSRGTDIDDLILNTTGTLIGGGLTKAMLVAVPSIKRYIGIRKEGTTQFRKKDGSFLPLLTFGILFAVIASGTYEREKIFSRGKQFWNTAQCNRPVIEKNIEEDSKEEKDQSKKDSNESLDLDASNIYFCNATTGNSLYSKNATKKIAPASTTKMLTSLVVLDHCKLDETVTVGDELKYVNKDASVAGLRRGMQLTIRDLLAALLLPSGNDAAFTLAAYVGRKLEGMDVSEKEAMQTFVDAMNKKAMEIGAKDSNFARPDGYDEENQYTTAYDMSIIANKFMQSETLKEISGSDHIRCVCEDGTDITFRNTNQLVCNGSPYYLQNVIGGKTGSSSDAGKCLVSVAEFDGQMYIAVVMGDSEEGRYIDSLQLYNIVRS